MNNSLFDVLGILIAFSSVMLLLSLVVTGLVQATQSFFRVRARNLQRGVEALLQSERFLGSFTGRETLRYHAARILNTPRIASVDRVNDPHSSLRRVLGPKVTWAKAEQLAEVLSRDAAFHAKSDFLTHVRTLADPTVPAEEKKKAESALAGLEGHFETAPKDSLPDDHSQIADRTQLIRMIQDAEPAWSNRFQFMTRMIAILWGLLVAVSFQVSATELFSMLVQDPATTKAIVDQRNEILGLARASGIEDLDLQSDHALDQLTKRFPQYRAQIDQAGNDGESKQELIRQLDDVLPEVEDRPKILECYALLLDKKQCSDNDISTTQSTPSGTDSAMEAAQKLSMFGIGLWSKGNDYYVHDGKLQGPTLVGVLITAFFLSFGAPFWFNILKELSALRDFRSPKQKKDESSGG